MHGRCGASSAAFSNLMEVLPLSFHPEAMVTIVTTVASTTSWKLPPSMGIYSLCIRPCDYCPPNFFQSSWIVLQHFAILSHDCPYVRGRLLIGYVQIVEYNNSRARCAISDWLNLFTVLKKNHSRRHLCASCGHLCQLAREQCSGWAQGVEEALTNMVVHAWSQRHLGGEIVVRGPEGNIVFFHMRAPQSAT